MRNVCSGIGSCQSGVSQSGVGAKEMHYVLRVLGPAACRDPDMFVQVARHTLQINLPPASLRGELHTDFSSKSYLESLPVQCLPSQSKI